MKTRIPMSIFATIVVMVYSIIFVVIFVMMIEDQEQRATFIKDVFQMIIVPVIGFVAIGWKVFELRETTETELLRKKEMEIKELKEELEAFRCEFRDHETSNGKIKDLIRQRSAKKGQLTRTTDDKIRPFPQPESAEGIILPPKEEL